MGALIRHDVDFYRRTFGLTAFVETGLFRGDGLAHAAQFPFKRLDSIEMSAEYVVAGRERFAGDPRVGLWQGRSEDVFRDLLPRLADHRIFFWLDAHLPEFYDMKAEDYRTTFPLNAELQVIADLRPECRDVILIDDARLYGIECAAGPVPDKDLSLPSLVLPVEFKGRLLRHDPRDEGYTLISPSLKFL